MNQNYTPVFLVLLELIGGYCGFLGLGWIVAGDVGRGLLILISYAALMAIGAALTFFSFGCLGFFFVPLYVAAPIVSTVKLYEVIKIA
ncbi:MAG: hypothetical protein KDJ65_23095 [Anaerolineae bacterium]|nr:hypothetical protein [Anaerolineae bacterium]